MSHSIAIAAYNPPRAQRGVALIVALVLLVVATLIGLAGVRTTNLQERMTANMYDRSLAFQRAEAALRAAEGAITANWKIADLGGLDCSPASATLCYIVPASAFTNANTNWVNVGTEFDVNDALTQGVPQYHIQFVGTGSSESNLGLEANADYNNYGNAYPPDDVAYYRVTARSSNPQDVGDQAIVVLQTTVKRAY
jgi:type IV pilus assembly protein PilX